MWIGVSFLHAITESCQGSSDEDHCSIKWAWIGETYVVEKADCVHFAFEALHFQINHHLIVPVIYVIHRCLHLHKTYLEKQPANITFDFLSIG